MNSRLNDRIVIFENTPSATGGGTFAPVWSTLSEVWANVKPYNETDERGQNKKQEIIKYNTIVRYDTTISNANKFTFEDKTHIIETVHDPTGTKKFKRIISYVENMS